MNIEQLKAHLDSDPEARLSRDTCYQLISQLETRGSAEPVGKIIKWLGSRTAIVSGEGLASVGLYEQLYAEQPVSPAQPVPAAVPYGYVNPNDAEQFKTHGYAQIESTKTEYSTLALYAQPVQAAGLVQCTPSEAQMEQLIAGLSSATVKESKHDFLRTWIRDWTVHKLGKVASMQAAVPDAMNYAPVGADHEENTMHQGYCNGWNDCRNAMLSAAPTPPSAEQLSLIEKNKARVWDYYQDLLKQNGFCGITDLLTKYHALERSIERPDSAVFEPIAWESTTEAYTQYITDAKYNKLSHASKQWYKPYKCSSCNKPKHITEQDAREMPEKTEAVKQELSHASVYLYSYVESLERTLLAKLNEQREPDYKARAESVYVSNETQIRPEVAAHIARQKSAQIVIDEDLTGEDSRTQFHAWASEKGFEMSEIWSSVGEPFESEDTQLAWEIWQASRAHSEAAKAGNHE